jgi:hypothetical protein
MASFGLRELIWTVDLTEEQVNTKRSFPLDKSWLSGFALQAIGHGHCDLEPLCNLRIAKAFRI